MKMIITVYLFLAGFNYYLYGASKLYPGVYLPEFNYYNSEEEIVDISKNYGKLPVVLSFFATYCKPCKVEIPYLIDKSDNNKVFHLILVSTDTGSSIKIREFFNSIKKLKTHPPYIYDPNGNLYVGFDTKKLPLTIFLGKSGKIVTVENGFKKNNIKYYDSIIKTLGDK